MKNRIFARLLKSDGKYHYGLWSEAVLEIGPLFEISVEGEDELPAAPHGTASVVEHERWLDALKSVGFTVKVTQVMEPESAGL